MLGAHVGVVPTLGFLPRLYEGTAYPDGEIVSAQMSSPDGRPKDSAPDPSSQGEQWGSYFYRRYRGLVTYLAVARGEMTAAGDGTEKDKLPTGDQ